jgi:hypothetical protein
LFASFAAFGAGTPAAGEAVMPVGTVNVIEDPVAFEKITVFVECETPETLPFAVVKLPKHPVDGSPQSAFVASKAATIFSAICVVVAPTGTVAPERVKLAELVVSVTAEAVRFVNVTTFVLSVADAFAFAPLTFSKQTPPVVTPHCALLLLIAASMFSAIVVVVSVPPE